MPKTLSRKADFALPAGRTYLNSAYTHPMLRASAANGRRYLRARVRGEESGWERTDIKAEFAALINAAPSEIAFVTSTTTGENMVVSGLDLSRRAGNVVTDAFHFEGALLHLEALRREGVDVRVVMPREGRIDLDDLDRAIDRETRLVEVSHVGMFTGFQHDLEAVCRLAHAKGAMVYVDAAQSAGATPLDVRASGVDFCACCSFKWLMGDFGLGFLYARDGLPGVRVRRTLHGYCQASGMETHFLPFDEPAGEAFSFRWRDDAAGYFELGTQSHAAWAALSASLPYIRRLGVANIEAHRQPLLERLRHQMGALGFAALTPPGTKSALLSFAVPDREAVSGRLRRAAVDATVGPHLLRISPSVFNTMADVERVIEALSGQS